MEQLYSNIGNISNLWSSNSQNLTNISDSKIIEIGKAINSISNDLSSNIKKNNNIAPTLVVVGSQSSGKSSILNGVLSMDLLPTGSSMVTRTPLNLELIQTNVDSTGKIMAAFGDYNQSNFVINKKIMLTNPIPTDEEVHEIQKYIEAETILKAGSEMNISDKEIHLKIYSPNVPNLNLIDLPGLTMVACTDKGQPKDIKTKIRNLITKYIAQENNIILSVMPAREDLEADIALDLCKEYDPKGERTIGILTKIDLMNTGNSVENYLTGNISKDLQLKYGYYAIKNRNKQEMETMNIFEGIKAEEAYFKTTAPYKNMDTEANKRVGIVNLSKRLSQILIENIRTHIPSIISEINVLYHKTVTELDDLGESLPTDNEAKMSLLNNILIKITNNFDIALDKRGSEINSGRQVKDCFIKYRKVIDSIQQFNEDKCSNEYLNELIQNCEGNHMSLPTPTIEMLEKCIKDEELNAFNDLLVPSLSCNRTIADVLSNLSNGLTGKYLSGLPKLALKIGELIKDEITRNEKQAVKKIDEIINMERNYIWTDDLAFTNYLKQLSSKQINHTTIRQSLFEYFKCVKSIIKHSIPKSIMLSLVTETSKNIQNNIYDIIQKDKKTYLDLIVEVKEVTDKRSKLKEYKTKLETSKKLLESL